MLNFSPLLGINPPIFGKKNPITKPLRLYRESKFITDQVNLATLRPQLIQTSRLLAANSPDRLHYSNRQSEIGWDNWRPIDRSVDRDDFNYKVDRSPYDLADRSSQTDQLENPELDFFTAVLPTDFAAIDPSLDSLPTNLIDLKIPTSTNKARPTAVDIKPQLPEKIQPKSIKPDQKSLGSNQINQIEQQKTSVQISPVFTKTQPSQTPQISPETVEGITIKSEAKSLLVEPLLETTIDSSLDNFGLNPVDNPLELLPATNIDLNLDMPRSPDLNLTQIARSIVDKVSRQENQIIPNLASSPELIPDPIVPNLLDTPTIINPAAPPKVVPLEPTANTNIVPESASPKILTQSTVGEQIATATEVTPIPESSDRLRADLIVPNPLDLPPVIDPQLPEVVTTQPPLLATATENIPSFMPLAVEPMGESISDTLPVDISDSRIVNQPPSTDPAEVSASLDPSAIANLDVPALTSALPAEDLTPTTSSLLAELGQNATAPTQISPEIQSLQQLIPATTQLNLAADLSNIDRESDPSIQLEPANPNILESSSTLPAETLPTNLLPIPDQQIATTPTSIETEADLQSTQLVSADTPQLNLLNPTAVNQAPSALEQISAFTDEPTPANLESSPIVEFFNTLSEPNLSIDPDLTIESISTVRLDSPQLNMDRSLLESLPLESGEVIKVDRENIAKSGNEFSSDNLLTSPLGDRSIINQPIADLLQNTNQLERLSEDNINESDDVVSLINNPIDNLTSAIQADSLTTSLPPIGQAKLSAISIDRLIDNSIDSPDANLADITIPAPTVGYATGGSVKDANHIDLQSISSSDTVSAMLTPGEFVINAKDAQKNLDLLTHINRGGEPEAALPNTEIQPSIIESPPTSPDISPTSIQRKRNDSLMPSSLQRDIGLQQLSPLTNPGLDTFESSQTESSNSSPTYSSPSMVFRKSMSSPQPQYTGADTPDQWGSIEDLINGGSNNSDPFSFENTSLQQPDLESRSSPSMSPTISPQYTSPIRGFANGGEVTPSDISTTIEPITQTIESPLANPQQQSENNDPAELEILAREIYHRLRQRLEIERERHGSYSGNLAW